VKCVSGKYWEASVDRTETSYLLRIWRRDTPEKEYENLLCYFDIKNSTYTKELLYSIFRFFNVSLYSEDGRSLIGILKGLFESNINLALVSIPRDFEPDDVYEQYAEELHIEELGFPITKSLSTPTKT